MGEEELKKVETEVPVTEPAPASSETAPPPPHPAPVEATKSVTEEKSLVPVVEEKEKVADTKALAVVDQVPDSTEGKKSGGSIDRDIVLTRVETEKRLSLIKAWEDSEKTKAENKAQRTKSTIESWEHTKIAQVDLQLKTIEEKLEKQKAGYVEKMKNKIAMIQKEAEEKKAMADAKRGEELLKAEEVAAKYRATNKAPKKLIGCFGY